MNSSGAARALGEKKDFHAASGGSGMRTEHEVEWDGVRDTTRLTISFFGPFSDTLHESFHRASHASSDLPRAEQLNYINCFSLISFILATLGALWFEHFRSFFPTERVFD